MDSSTIGRYFWILRVARPLSGIITVHPRLKGFHRTSHPLYVAGRNPYLRNRAKTAATATHDCNRTRSRMAVASPGYRDIYFTRAQARDVAAWSTLRP